MTDEPKRALRRKLSLGQCCPKTFGACSEKLNRSHRPQGLWHRRYRHGMPDSIVHLVFQPGTALLQFLELLVRGEINLFFNAANRIVQRMILVEPFPEPLVTTLQASNGFTMFREFLVYRMMEVHGSYVTDRQREWSVKGVFPFRLMRGGLPAHVTSRLCDVRGMDMAFRRSHLNPIWTVVKRNLWAALGWESHPVSAAKTA